MSNEPPVESNEPNGEDGLFGDSTGEEQILPFEDKSSSLSLNPLVEALPALEDNFRAFLSSFRAALLI